MTADVEVLPRYSRAGDVVRDLISSGLLPLAGGLFLIYKATHEIHAALEGDEGEASAKVLAKYGAVVNPILSRAAASGVVLGKGTPAVILDDDGEGVVMEGLELIGVPLRPSSSSASSSRSSPPTVNGLSATR